MSSTDGATGDWPGATLFDRLGGSFVLRSAIDDFYQAVLGDPALMPYFQDADVATIRRHQLDLFTQILGGPAAYTGQGLAAAHQPLGIPVEHYQLVVGHLVATLVGKGISDDAFAAIGEAANDVQDQIVHIPDDEPPHPASRSRPTPQARS